MTVTAVVVPWRAGCPHREAALGWVRARYADTHPDWPVILGGCGPGPFSRSQAIIAGARHTDADVVVVADGDVWCDPAAAVAQVDSHGWAVPHGRIHRLSADSTERVLAGADWRGLPLSTDNRQDSRPYRGREAGTLLVLRRDVLDAVPPDPRFVAWGQEDTAWAYALRCLVGPPWRGDADLCHLWHPPQPRLNRVKGSAEGWALAERYRRARRNPAAMRTLLAEATTHVRQGAVA